MRAIVVLLHEGGTPSPFAGIDQCNVAGAITDIVDRTSDAVDLFVTGHTHQPCVCSAANNSLIDGRPVTSASSFGRLVTNIRFARPPDEGHQERHGRQHDRHPHEDPGFGHPGADRRLQHAGGPDREPARRPDLRGIPRETTPNCAGSLSLNPLGHLIADAQLADTDDADRGDADIALMNPGGVRADLTFASSTKAAGEGDGVVTYGEAFSVQPFNNIVVTNTFTGARLLGVLETGGARARGSCCCLRPTSRTPTTSPTRPRHRRGVQPERAEPRVGRAHQRRAARPGHLPGDDEQLPRDGGDSFQSLRAGAGRTSRATSTSTRWSAARAPLAGSPIGLPPLNRITVVP